MLHAALGSVCVFMRVRMHAWMRAWAHAWGACVCMWARPSRCDHAALCWLRGVSSPKGAGMGRSPVSLPAEAAQIKGSGVCFCHTLISTSLSPDLSIIKCQGRDENMEII